MPFRRAGLSVVSALVVLGTALVTVPAAHAADVTPPTIDSTDGSPGWVRYAGDFTPLTFSWTGSDDDPAPLQYDVQVNGSADPVHGWHALPGVPETTATSVTFQEPNEARDCFRVRAVDAAGNRSTWSTPRCSWVDRYPPDMMDGHFDSHHFTLPLHALGPHRTAYHFRGTDTAGVASYDVEERSPGPDGTLGPWRSPRSTQGLAHGPLPVRMRSGEETCFRARARDHVGHLSGYGDEHCITEPVDDRALVDHGGNRLRSAWGLGDTVTVLRGARQSLVAPHQVGHQLWVRVRSRSDVCPRVWWGGRQVMQSCDEWGHWFIATVTHLHRGAVRIEQGEPAEALEVDALAVVR